MCRRRGVERAARFSYARRLMPAIIVDVAARAAIYAMPCKRIRRDAELFAAVTRHAPLR